MHEDWTQIDQIVYRWSTRTLTGDRGVGPIATSLDMDRLRYWDEQLRERIWAVSDDSGMACLSVDDQFVVLHKEPVMDEEGRPGSTLAHVLIGRGMAPSLALGLWDWTGWTRESDTVDNSLKPLRLRDLRFEADSGRVRLRDRARKVSPSMLAELLAEMMDEPSGNLTVIAPDTPAAELMCALLDIVGDLDMHWTFATREASDTGKMVPKVVFLVETPQFSTRGVSRRRIRLDAPGRRSELWDFALALATRYVRDGASAIGQFRPSRPLDTKKDAMDWAADAQFAPGVLADADDLFKRAATESLSTAEQAVVHSARFEQNLVAIVRAVSDEGLVELVRSSRPDGPGQQQLYRELIRRQVAGRLNLTCNEIGAIRLPPAQVIGELKATEAYTHGLALGQVLPFVRTLSGYGLTGGDQRGILSVALKPLATGVLLEWISANAKVWPDVTEQVLVSMSGRKDRGGDLAGAREFFLAQHGMADAVEYMRPGPPSAAVSLFQLLVVLTISADLRRPSRIRQVLYRLGPHPAPALLYVLHSLTRGRVRSHVRTWLAEQYFLVNGIIREPR